MMWCGLQVRVLCSALRQSSECLLALSLQQRLVNPQGPFKGQVVNIVDFLAAYFFFSSSALLGRK
jgi:hypothetical protein